MDTPTIFILGSSSPRRKAILEYFDLPFLQVSSSFDESSIPLDGDIKDHIKTLAEKKGEYIDLEKLNRGFDQPLSILTADTLVELNGKIFGKPKNESKYKSKINPSHI